MSHQQSKLKRQLEQATAAQPDAPLDAETDALRQGWLALGQLLEAAYPGADETVKLPEPPRRTVRAGWKVTGIAAVAASLLVGVTLAWIAAGGSDRAAGPSPSSGRIAQGNPKQPAPAEKQPPPATDDLEWDDSLDQQLVSVGQQLVGIQEDWDRVDEAFGAVQDGLEQVAEEIEDNPL